MPFSFGKYPSCLRGLLAIIVYASFYLVQLIYVTGPDNLGIVSTLSFHRTTAKEISVDKQHGQVKTIRATLNKRFQHAIGATILPVAIESPVYYNGIVYTLNPAGYLLISFSGVTSLRGPPAIS